MNSEEIKLTEYLHNIIENNMSLRKENDRLWEQKLEYIDRISKAVEYIKHSWWLRADQVYDTSKDLKGWEVEQLLEILKGEKEC